MNRTSSIFFSLAILAIVFSLLFDTSSVKATLYMNEDFETWNSNGWTIYTDGGTQSDETTIVHNGLHSREFVTDAIDERSFIYKYEYMTSTFSAVTFYLYLPLDTNLLNDSTSENRKEVFEFWSTLACDFGIWNNSGTIESYTVGWSINNYLTNASLSLGVWHQIGIAVNWTDQGNMWFGLDGSLVCTDEGNYTSDWPTASVYVGSDIHWGHSPLTCYIDDLVLTDDFSSWMSGGIYTIEVSSLPIDASVLWEDGILYDLPHNFSAYSGMNHNITASTSLRWNVSTAYLFEGWSIDGSPNVNTSNPLIFYLADDMTLQLIYSPKEIPDWSRVWMNFGIGLIGLIMMFLSWFIGYWIHKEGDTPKAVLVAFVMFLVGYGLFTVLLGG